MSCSMRRTLSMLLLLMPTVLLYAQQNANEQSGPSDEASQLLALTNEARSEQGLGPLRWDPALAAAAEQHNAIMRAQPDLSHQYRDEPPLVQRASQMGAHFAVIAENIAMGPNVPAIQREWLHSVPHRANIFDPRMDSIGIAIAHRGSDLFATEDFSHAVESISPASAEARVGSLLRQQGLAIDTQPDAIRDARETCEMNSGTAGTLKPRFTIRWEGANLDQLPPELTQRIATGQYKSAVVGFCTSMHPQQGFTTYRVAALIF